MAGATILTINIQLNAPFTFNANTITVASTLSVDGQSPQPVTLTRVSTTEATGILNINVSPGPHTFQLIIDVRGISPIPPTGTIMGTFTLAFNDVPPSTSPPTPFIKIASPATMPLAAGEVQMNIACIHGSSLITTRNGLKRIDKLKVDDEVLSGKNLDEYAKVKGIAQCWIQSPGPDHDAIIFEPNSLGENEPLERLIIDPGHPMSIKSEYLKNGIESLKPAGSFLDEIKNISVKKWTHSSVQEYPSVRYDLILEEPYYTYVANDVVVKSANGNPYNHRYKNLI